MDIDDPKKDVSKRMNAAIREVCYLQRPAAHSSSDSVLQRQRPGRSPRMAGCWSSSCYYHAPVVATRYAQELLRLGGEPWLGRRRGGGGEIFHCWKCSFRRWKMLVQWMRRDDYF